MGRVDPVAEAHPREHGEHRGVDAVTDDQYIATATGQEAGDKGVDGIL